MTFALVALALAAVSDSVFENADAWKQLDIDGELTVDQRPIAGSALNEYRIRTTTEVPVTTLCSAVFEWGTHGGGNPTVKLSKLLKDEADERVVYTPIDQPLISNRDSATTVRKTSLPERLCRIRFKATNELAAPKPNVWGGWELEPLPGGETHMTHLLFADPGGSVPTFLVHGRQKNSAKKSVSMALQKSRAVTKAGP